jgi:hypothetical protein
LDSTAIEAESVLAFAQADVEVQLVTGAGESDKVGQTPCP